MKIKVQEPHLAELRSLRPLFLDPVELEVEAEVIGDVVVYKSPISLYWIATNRRTGAATNNAERAVAIAEVM